MPDSAVPAQEAAPTANPFAPAAEATAPAPDAAQTFDLDYVKGLRAEAAKARVEAKANADAAKRLAELEAASKTEAERTAERIKSLEDAVAASALEALRARVAAAHGVGPEDAALLLTGTTEETLTAQAARLAQARTQPSPRSPNAGRGGAGTDADASIRAIAHEFFTQ